MKLLDVVALLEDLPEINLYRGQVGTIVEVYEPGIFEVEFSDNNGRAYAMKTLKKKQLVLLYHEPISKIMPSKQIKKTVFSNYRIL